MKFPTDMDRECLAICEAISSIPGIQTNESCCGHGREPFAVWFDVGPRQLRDRSPLTYLLYHISSCHVYLPDGRWRCELTTDCSACRPHFSIHSPNRGEAAYADADRIAKAIRVWLEDAK